MCMFNLTHRLPDRYFVAVSGGIDSMAALHWLNTASNKDSFLGVIHVNHGTGEFADKAEDFVKGYVGGYLGIPTMVRRVTEPLPKGVSKEAWWRDMRYERFKAVEPEDASIILAHNMDDCLEEYIMCTIVRGFQGTIPYKRGRCVRPFRTWKRVDIEEYVERNSIPFIEDPTNADSTFKRNFIRHEIVPKILDLNPGVYNLVRDAIYEQDDFDSGSF